MARRPNVAAALGDFTFALLALWAGIIGLPPVYAAMVAVGSVAAWLWTRRAALAQMDWAKRAANGAIALVMILVVLAASYWLGLVIGGHA